MNNMYKRYYLRKFNSLNGFTINLINNFELYIKIIMFSVIKQKLPDFVKL